MTARPSRLWCRYACAPRTPGIRWIMSRLCPGLGSVEDTVRLVQQEIQLAKIELKEMIQRDLKAAIFLGAAALCGLLFFIMLLVTIALIIPEHALVAGIETVVFLVLAIILGLVGKAMLTIGPPPKTMTTLKEDAEWAKQVLKRNGK